VSVQDLTAEPSVSGIVLTAHDVTDRRAMQAEMERRTLHDPLTGLPNRALLTDLINDALHDAERDGTSAGLLLLDLDRLREVNDTFGHHYGDELLRQIGPRLAGELRGVDTVARLGGDEFAVLLPDIHGIDDAVSTATAILAALAVPIPVENVDMDVEASVGVVISGEHGQDASTLLLQADIAMYVAKTQHLGVFVYDPAVDEHSAAKLALVGDLRRALGRGELVLYYQPKVSVATGEVVGAEALVRWQHPVHGLILPDAFIPLAERTRLIDPLTRYVLDAALVQARIWMDAGRPLKIAVNLSAHNLHDERFVAFFNGGGMEYEGGTTTSGGALANETFHTDSPVVVCSRDPWQRHTPTTRMTALGPRPRDVPADDQHGAIAEEGVDQPQLRGLAAGEHEGQPELLRRVGMARRADALRARTELLADPADGDRPVAVHHAGLLRDLEGRTV
ncbi:MAG: diguanylate cyclase, partial [Actinobacteria bacterium]|nr:diguanylate cyclase [Actinomycetota bacterium]